MSNQKANWTEAEKKAAQAAYDRQVALQNAPEPKRMSQRAKLNAYKRFKTIFR